MDSNVLFLLLLLTFFGVTLAWPLNVPLMALAYKVRVGSREVPLPLATFWWSSALAAFTLFGLSSIPLVVAIGASHLLTADQSGLSALILFGFFVYAFIYFPLASILIYRIYGLDDPVEGFSTLALYLLLPGIPLFLLLWGTGFGRIITLYLKA